MDYSAPKGMRDFLPEQMQKREWAIDTIKGVYRSFCFVPMDTPALERVDVLEKKCGNEIKGQLFRIEDNELAMRFDLTVPLSRVASSNTFKKPFKRYCIGPVWRREEPQKGRFREFLQADADIIGCASYRAEAELIACAAAALEALGFPGACIKINDRRIITKIAQGVLPGKELDALRILDKREKIGEEATVGMLVDAGADEKGASQLIMDITKGGKWEERLKIAEKYSPEGAAALGEIISLLKGYSRGIKIEVDFSLVRGLDYYTGPIFEISLGKEMGSVAGGGRYDGLLSLYGQGDSAVGISLGIERILVLMKERSQDRRGVFVANIGEGTYAYALQAASELRAAGICAQTDLNGRNLKKQIEYASSCCEYIAIAGEAEKKEGKITLRNLESGEEEKLKIGDAAEKILRAGKKAKS